ncbi:hypothetical protein H7J87_32605 [Mycolicibacterium wolinskyi]|nr:hypothetical protein [Mycolicibacterium wolinskyi]MCV7293113.1 hypothetical protein [Mycolicibacterium goodii]
MPALQQRLRRRCCRESPGGIVTCGVDALYDEVSYLAYHLHWQLDAVLDLEHADRRRFVQLTRNLATQN